MSDLIKLRSAQSAHFSKLLDGCRGVAALWIFFIHYFPTWFGWQAVHIFLVLSGFGLTYSCLQKPTVWTDWYIKRFRKILPAYWLVCFVGYFVMAGLYLWDGNSLLESLSLPKRTLFVDLTLLKNFHHGTIMGAPNVSLWFVPLIVSFYLVFPLLYRLIAQQPVKALKTTLLWLLVFELVYRAAAIYWLDGYSIGSSAIFDRLPESFWFQHEAPFGIFPARVAEFALGMAAAAFYFQEPDRFQSKLLNPKTGWSGFAIWMIGDFMPRTTFWGAVSFDFVVALGLILWLINLIAWMSRYLPRVFAQLSRISPASYYIFLTHHIAIFALVIHPPKRLGLEFNVFFARTWYEILLGAGIFALVCWVVKLSCELLSRFDRSQWADQVIQLSVAKVLQRC